MRRAPRRCACGHTVPPGKACPCQVRRGYSPDGKRPSAHRRGYTAQWRAAAAAFLARPENQWCACGCGKRAEMVDHKHGRAGPLMMDQANWQPMTIACNSRKNAKHEGGFGNSPN